MSEFPPADRSIGCKLQVALALRLAIKAVWLSRSDAGVRLRPAFPFAASRRGWPRFTVGDAPMPERAIIYVPDDDMERCTILCLEYAQRVGYLVVGVVVGRWNDAQSMVLAGVADLVIVADRAQLPPDRTPRIEVVDEHARPDQSQDGEGPPTSPRRRRPKPIC